MCRVFLRQSLWLSGASRPVVWRLLPLVMPLAERHALYQAARERHPRRWTTTTRNWTPISAVTLNPERDSVVPTTRTDIQLAA